VASVDRATAADSLQIVLRSFDDRGDGRVRRGFRWTARVLLAAVALLLPFWNGGASWNALVLAFAVVALAWLAAWPAIPHQPARTAIAWLWVGLGVATALLVVPLPQGLVGLLHPRAVDHAQAAAAALGTDPPHFLPLALAPGDTAMQAALYLVAGTASGLAALVLMGSHGRDSVGTFGSLLLAAALTQGAFWLGAHLPAETTMLPAGLSTRLGQLCFVNANHEAMFLNLGVAVAVGRVVQNPAHGKQLAYGIAAVVLALVIVTTGSRGGMVATCLCVALSVLNVPIAPKTARRDRDREARDARRRALSIAAALALVIALVALPAVEAEFAATDAHRDPKMAPWRILSKVMSGAWLTGMGAGGLPVVAGAQAGLSPYRINFGENLVVDRLLTNGVVVSVVFLAGLAWVLRNLRRRAKGTTTSGPFLVALFTTLAHNLVDFSLEVAGGLVPVLVVGAALERALPPATWMDEAAQNDRRFEYRHRMRILFGSGAAMTVALVMLAASHGTLTREVPALLASTDIAASKALISAHFAHDHHAFYQLGRKLEQAGDLRGALPAFDRAVALRPDSTHARLFRFATLLELGMSARATDELRWLLAHADQERARVLEICSRSQRCEQTLLAALALEPVAAEQVAMQYMQTRPDLAERIAVAVHKAHPQKRYRVDAVRGHLYVSAGHLEPARRIAAELMANSETRNAGYNLEARTLEYSGKWYEAFHLRHEVCERAPADTDACMTAVQDLLAAHQPAQALQYVRARYPKLRANPVTAAKYWYWLGMAQLQLERYDDALESARVAHGLMRDDTPTAMLLADCLLRTGNHGEARDVLDRLHSRLPSDSTVKSMLRQIEAETRPIGYGIGHDVTPPYGIAP
jgi:tetratricopeptide (TPR) repeat protein